MNVKELCIGNFVNASKYLDHDNELNVICIEDINLFTINNKYWAEKIFGIAITPDWLLKLKVTPIDEYPTPVITKDKDRGSYYIDIENGYNKFDLMWFDSIVYLKSRYQGEDLNFQALPHIKYVHQFQNLYNSLSGRYLTL